MNRNTFVLIVVYQLLLNLMLTARRFLALTYSHDSSLLLVRIRTRHHLKDLMV